MLSTIMITSIHTRYPLSACESLASLGKGYNAAGKIVALDDPACLSPEAYAALYPSNGVSSDEEDDDDDKDLPRPTTKARRYAQQDHDYYVSLEQDSPQDQAGRGGDEKEEGGKSREGGDEVEAHVRESDDERSEREFRRKFPAGLPDIVKRARKSGINLVNINDFDSFAGGVGVGKDLERYLAWVPKLRSEGWEIEGGIERRVYWVWAVLREHKDPQLDLVPSTPKSLLSATSMNPFRFLVQPSSSSFKYILHESILMPPKARAVAAIEGEGSVA